MLLRSLDIKDIVAITTHVWQETNLPGETSIADRSHKRCRYPVHPATWRSLCEPDDRADRLCSLLGENQDSCVLGREFSGPSGTVRYCVGLPRSSIHDNAADRLLFPGRLRYDRLCGGLVLRPDGQKLAVLPLTEQPISVIDIPFELDGSDDRLE